MSEARSDYNVELFDVFFFKNVYFLVMRLEETNMKVIIDNI